MKRIILLFLLFSYVLNTMNQCDGSRDQDQDTCPSIDIEYEDFSCYKRSYVEDNNEKCITLPKNKKLQQLYLTFRNGLIKEFHSAFAENIIEGEEDRDMPLLEGVKNFIWRGRNFWT